MLRYDATAACRLLTHRRPNDIAAALGQARDEVVADLELYNSGGPVPDAKDPLDAGFIEYPVKLLEGRTSEVTLDGITTVAAGLCEHVDTVVNLGIGGSYMGARALFDALCHRYHNQRPATERKTPRFYFDGHNVDNDCQSELLDLLSRTSERWGIIVISKSGGTLETAAAFRLFRQALSESAGAEASKRIVPITGQSGKLRSLSKELGIADSQVLPVPDGIGGRFSILTPVGLLPAAVMGLNIEKILQGAADMTRRFFEADPGDNPVLDYVAVGHLFEVDQQMPIRVLSTWGDRLESVGLWYDQLLAESLGKEERGATPLTVVNTRDLHSRGQQHQEGARDRVITNLIVEEPTRDALRVPEVPDILNEDQLNAYAQKGLSVHDIQSAALRGTNQAYAEANRPTADLLLPKLDEYALGELFQMLMLATVLEGRLIDINPYGQPGVEDYKRNMKAILDG